MTEHLSLFYLSFVDVEDPAKPTWSGGMYLLAEDAMDAVSRAWELGQNPGGEVAIAEAPPEILPTIRPGYMSRLLTIEELKVAIPGTKLRRGNGAEV